MKPFFHAILLLFALLATTTPADTLREGPFTVTFHPDDRDAAEESLRYLLDAQNEFERFLPLGEEPVDVHIAHNEDEFQAFTGPYAHVGVNGVTIAERSAIALKSPRLRSIADDYRGTVRHELVHVLLHRNTDTQKLPRWLNEGICMMLANEIRWESNVPVSWMHLTGQIIPLDELDRVFRQPEGDRDFGNAYAQALSMTRYLRDSAGEDRFWEMVRAMRSTTFEGALAGVAGVPEDAFWRGYTGSLWNLSLITTLRTGSFWGVLAALCIVVFGVRVIRNRRIIHRWEREDRNNEPEPFDWDRILEDAEAWKRGTDPNP